MDTVSFLFRGSPKWNKIWDAAAVLPGSIHSWHSIFLTESPSNSLCPSWPPSWKTPFLTWTSPVKHELLYWYMKIDAINKATIQSQPKMRQQNQARWPRGLLDNHHPLFCAEDTNVVWAFPATGSRSSRRHPMILNQWQRSGAFVHKCKWAHKHGETLAGEMGLIVRPVLTDSLNNSTYYTSFFLFSPPPAMILIKNKNKMALAALAALKNAFQELLLISAWFR